MSRRSRQGDPRTELISVVRLLRRFEVELDEGSLRDRVQALVPVVHGLRDLGCSLVPVDDASSARDRILLYLRRHPRVRIHGDELMVVAGIGEWARRVRELRVEAGWNIATGSTIHQMLAEDGTSPDMDWLRDMAPNEYVLLSEDQDREAAHRWHTANRLRRSRLSVKDRVLAFFRENVGKPVTGEELKYLAKEASEWARRVRELRTEDGWPVFTRNTGRLDLPVGSYVLQEDRQSPPHDRRIPDDVRMTVLERDGYACQSCGWRRADWHPDDPRNLLELHHRQAHVEGGANTVGNLVTLCNVCHDRVHAGEVG